MCSTQAIQAVNSSSIAFCKFLSANDTGLTGSHQIGIYIPKESFEILFDTPGRRGENKDRYVTINWQEGEEVTESRFIYYGRRTRNEYRITRFGRNFPYLTPDHTGDLFVLSRSEQDDYYNAYILSTDEEMENFFNAFSIFPMEGGELIDVNERLTLATPAELRERDYFQEFFEYMSGEFPPSVEMSEAARTIYRRHNPRQDVIRHPDEAVVQWTETEYELFAYFERGNYLPLISDGFDNVDDFVRLANTVLNRRKSRAGHSLEHHLATIFDIHEVRYSAQAKTEGNKRPDFILPSIELYKDDDFDSDGLTSLAAKTTCKDRWRQILNEANRISTKHLFTLQQGVSPNQMQEMRNEGVQLVVPQRYINIYPPENRHELMTLGQFIDYAKHKEGIYLY